jgi:TonB family protein
MPAPQPQRSRPESAPTLGHLSVSLVDRPQETHFLFEEQKKNRLGGALGMSIASHAGFVLLILLAIRLMPDRVVEAILPDRLPREIVWLAEPGAGGGGGGGGNQMKEPPRKAELPGKQEISVPAVKPAAPTPEPVKEEPPPEDLNIPAKTLGADKLVMPGLLESQSASVSQGIGTGGGAGTGTGTGIGAGEGSGLGPGSGGGTGGGVYRPGNGVTLPRVLREVKPKYTADAMRAKVQGTVWLECVVNPDGTVGKVEVVRSLDRTFGLDNEAIEAAKQWRFSPGLRLGEPVAVLVTIELTFTLR